MDDERTIGEVYNIGSQRLVTIRELAELVIKRTGSSSKISVIPYEKAYAAGFEDMYRRMPDNSRIRELTGWQVQRSLEDIIDDVAADLKNRIG